MHSFFMNFQRKFLHNNHKEHGQIVTDVYFSQK